MQMEKCIRNRFYASPNNIYLYTVYSLAHAFSFKSPPQHLSKFHPTPGLAKAFHNLYIFVVTSIIIIYIFNETYIYLRHIIVYVVTRTAFYIFLFFCWQVAVFISIKTASTNTRMVLVAHLRRSTQRANF